MDKTCFTESEEISREIIGIYILKKKLGNDWVGRWRATHNRKKSHSWPEEDVARQRLQNLQELLPNNFLITLPFYRKGGQINFYQICKPWRALSPWTLKKQPAVSTVDIFPWLTNATKAASRQVFNVTLSCSPTRWRRYDRPEFKHLLQVISSKSVVAQLLVTSLKFGDCNIWIMVVIPTHW